MFKEPYKFQFIVLVLREGEREGVGVEELTHDSKHICDYRVGMRVHVHVYSTPGDL